MVLAEAPRPTNLVLKVEEKHHCLVQTSNKCHIIIKLIAFIVKIKKIVMQKMIVPTHRESY